MYLEGTFTKIVQTHKTVQTRISREIQYLERIFTKTVQTHNLKRDEYDPYHISKTSQTDKSKHFRFNKSHDHSIDDCITDWPAPKHEHSPTNMWLNHKEENREYKWRLFLYNLFAHIQELSFIINEIC